MFFLDRSTSWILKSQVAGSANRCSPEGSIRMCFQQLLFGKLVMYNAHFQFALSILLPEDGSQIETKMRQHVHSTNAKILVLVNTLRASFRNEANHHCIDKTTPFAQGTLSRKRAQKELSGNCCLRNIVRLKIERFSELIDSFN